jgi:hypothetical protein
MKKRGLGKTLNDPANALLQQGDIEVDQESDRQLRKLEVGQHLRRVDGIERTYGLQFDQQCLLYDEIHSVPAIEVDSSVLDRQGELAQDLESHAAKLVDKARLVGGLEKAGAERSMDFHRSSDDFSG